MPERLQAILNPRPRYSIAPKFKMKTIAAKFLNEFGSTATHVSAVNKRRSKVNAEIWISGSKAGFAIGAIHIGSKKSGPVTFALQAFNS